MRYRNSQNAYKTGTTASDGNDFNSPLRVMIYLILSLGLFEVLTVR